MWFDELIEKQNIQTTKILQNSETKLSKTTTPQVLSFECCFHCSLHSMETLHVILWNVFFLQTERSSAIPECTPAFHLLEVLPYVLFIFLSLLLSQLCDVVLQVHDGTLNLVIFTHKGHPAVKDKNQTVWSLCALARGKMPHWFSICPCV